MRPPGALTEKQMAKLQKRIQAGNPTKLYWVSKERSWHRLNSAMFHDHEADLLDIKTVWWFSNYFHAMAYEMKRQKRILKEAPPDC